MKHIKVGCYRFSFDKKNGTKRPPKSIHFSCNYASKKQIFFGREEGEKGGGGVGEWF